MNGVCVCVHALTHNLRAGVRVGDVAATIAAVGGGADGGGVPH